MKKDAGLRVAVAKAARDKWGNGELPPWEKSDPIWCKKWLKVADAVLKVVHDWPKKEGDQ